MINCKFCDAKINNITFDLGNTAISNALLKQEELNTLEKIFPLVLYTCPKCYLVQIDCDIESSVIFNEEYVYFSSLSSFWLEHAKKYCEDIKKYLSLDSKSFVIEIASNDGYLLKNFLEMDIECLGVEASRNTAHVALSMISCRL